ncbi:MAG: curved DNA-binding protein CbpA [Gammaproteobacteria bacterium]|jgi:curved DNA-binding protein CbpA
MKNKPNYYQVLHVQSDAPREIIRSSYRTMMQHMRMHPDLGGDDHNAAIINEAYATLTEPLDRAAYDKTRFKKEPRRNEVKPAPRNIQRATPAPLLCHFCKTVQELSVNLPVEASCNNCHSPLTLAGQFQYGDGSRRTIERIPTNHVIVFCTYWPQSEPCSGRTDDISLNGMKFNSTAPLHLGQIIKIDSQILRAVGKVTRSQAKNGEWEVGVQFVSLFFEQAKGSFVTAQA